MIRPLKPKDIHNFISFCQTRDKFSDFYITQDRKRLFLNNAIVAKKLFNDCLKHGDKCFVKEENNSISAILLVVGYKGKFPRKYVKMLTTCENDIKDLLNYLQWQKLPNLFVKAKKTNRNFLKYDERTKKYKPTYFMRKNGFRIIVERDKEILLKKEEYRRVYNKYNNKRN